MRSLARLLAIGLAFTALPLTAEEVPPPPAVGTSAPDFRLQDQDGKWHTLDEYAGKWVVLYFYPKDGTPGCTKQVCKYRDEIAKVRAAGAEVLGVSVDDVSSHEKFAKEHNVPFPLLADSDKATAKAYGVLISKFGFTFARRDTFLIDPQGKVAKYYQDVDPEKNVEQVLQDLSSLKAS
jgi:peroxiredoxin Q/BCP